MSQKIIIKNSSGTTLPTLEVGELAINFKSGSETLYTKNSNDEIIGFNEWSKILNRPSSLIALVTGTQTAATSSWKGVLDSVSELYDGLTINYWLPYAGVSSATLNLTLSGGTTTGAINLYYGGTTRLSTHYGAGNIIQLTYRINANINGAPYTGWWAKANYDTSDNYTHRRYGVYKIGVGAIAANTIIAYDANGYIVNALTTNFDINQSILWCGSAYSANSTGSNANIYEAHYNVSIAGTGFSGMTLYNPIFLKGTLYNNMFTAVGLTQTIPSSEDGFIYILVGAPQNTTNTIQFFFKNQLFTYTNGAFRQFTPHAGIANKLSATRTIWGQNFDGTGNVSGSINNVIDIIADTYSIHNSTTNPYLKLTLNGLNWYIQAYQDRLYFGYGLSNSLNIDSSGNVGIGTTSPSFKLDVSGSTRISDKLYLDRNNVNNTIGFRNNGVDKVSCGYEYTQSGFTFYNFTSTKNLFIADNGDLKYDNFIVKSSGDVGVGTTSPSYKLDVNGTGRFSDTLLTKNIIFNSNNTWGNLGSVLCTWGNNGGYPTLYGSSAERWVMHINPHISYVQNGIGEYTGAMNGATIRFAGNTAGSIAWDLGVGCNSVGSDKFSIGRSESSFVSLDNAGNFGIGTTSPSYKLDVSGAIRSNYVLFKNYNDNGLAGYVGRGSSSSNKIMLNGYAGNSVTLGSNGSDDDLCIHTSHNVSIGTGSDTGYKLYVNGTFRVNYNYSTTFTGNDINFTRTDGSSYINAGQTLSLGAGGTSGVLNLTNANVATFKELLLADGARIYSAAGAGLGISLFNEPSFNPNYGLMFAQTVYKGKHGAVNGDWATYFTMSPDAGRGWIFTSNAAGTGGNVASISNWGNLTCSGEVTAYSASDIRLKTNIKPICSAIDVINKLNPVQYNWNSVAKELNPLKDDSTEYGLIAQELEKVMPELVHEIYGKYKSIDYVKLVPILIKAVQELKSETDFQQTKIEKLEKLVKQNRWLS